MFTVSHSLHFLIAAIVIVSVLFHFGMKLFLPFAT